MRSIVFGSVLAIVGVLIFSFGFCYGTRVGALAEMSALEALFVENSGVLADCRKVKCDAQLRDGVISMNDIALSKYDSLERLQNADWFTSMYGFGLRGLAITSSTPITRSASAWRSVFKSEPKEPR